MISQEFKCLSCGKLRPITEVTLGKFTGVCIACELMKELDVELHLHHDRIKQNNGSVNPKFIAAVNNALNAIQYWEEN